MNYQLHHEGQDLGIVSLQELHRRRQAGELSGAYVWREGMTDWQSLDDILAAEGLATASAPPPLPSKKPKSRALMIGGISAAVALGVMAVVALFVIRSMGPQIERALRTASGSSDADAGLVERPIPTATNTITYKVAHERSRQFRIRQWIEGYTERSVRGGPCDQQSLHALETWLAQTYGGATNGETEAASVLFDRLVSRPDCEDPMVLTIAGIQTTDSAEKVRRLERALERFPNSQHRGYPQFYAAVTLLGTDSYPVNKERSLFSAAVRHWGSCLRDGSIQPEDEPELADIFITGWAYNFFYRLPVPIVQTAKSSNFKWLALMLEGEHHVIEAWRARGSGFANTVSQQGWEGFRTNLFVARQCFSNAWQMRPDRPLAAARMVYVSMSDSEASEMRVWFDRALAAQIDHQQAWGSMRFGLRPRWHGTLETMLALGKTAVDTERFDTDVPRKLFDIVLDLESELQIRPGKHIYGRPDIWPLFQRMYEGYIAEPIEATNAPGWRTTYAIVAYFAGKYDVAREQLAALNWQATPWNFRNWGADVSLLVPEVAARTGPLATRVAVAESKRLEGDVAGSLETFKELQASSEADERTLTFIRRRVDALELETRMNTQTWVNFLPAKQNDEAWHLAAGKMLRAPDGVLEVEAGEQGYLLFPRARTGSAFELKGEFETVSAPGGTFEAGFMVGIPEIDGTHSMTLRLRQDSTGGRVLFSQGEGLVGTNSPVTLNADRNTFHLRFQEGRATLDLNGRQVLREARAARTDWRFGDEILVGLGTAHAQKESSLRFRNVQFRRLTE